MIQNTTDNKKAYLLNFYSLFWLFMFGSVIGFILEGIWCVLRLGYWENHSAVVWGPFCIIYGLGMAAVYILSSFLSGKSILIQFCTYMIAGTILEYGCGLFQEICFDSASWNYSKHFMNINGRISLQMTLMWGGLGIAFAQFVIPTLNQYLSRMHSAPWICLAWVLLCFMILNLTVSCAAVHRWQERQKHLPPDNELEILLDSRYDDSRMTELYPTMRFL